MKIRDLFRSDKIHSIREVGPRTTDMALETHTRGRRDITLNLSIDEIEDILVAASNAKP